MLTRGFTLLEVLIAITITALIGVGSVQLLSNIVESRRLTEIRAEQLTSLQRFNMVVSRDMEQIINRSIRDQYGDTQPGLIADSSEYALEFTRTGWRNSPFSENPRSELQRVAYQLYPLESTACDSARARLESWGIEINKSHCLVRLFWPVLDRAPNSEPIAQVILEQVDALEIDLYVTAEIASEETISTANKNAKGEWLNVWPSLDADAGANLEAIRWRITLPALGNIERLWLLAWRQE